MKVQWKAEIMFYSRFAIYYVPPEGPLAEFGASWLGWDLVTGQETSDSDIAGPDSITRTPRKYGFHGTLKPPFRLADGQDQAALAAATADLAAQTAPGECDGLALSTLGRFLALTPQGDASGLARIAAASVRGLDLFRAPATEAELARRQRSRLSVRQAALLAEWGYPYVMDEFRFHMTLTGALPRGDIPQWKDSIQRQLPALPAPFVVDQIALCGERDDGRFELIDRYSLSG